MLDRYGQVAVYHEGAQGAQLRIAGNKHGQGRVGALHEPDQAAVAELRCAGSDVVHEDGQRGRQVVARPGGEEGYETAEVAAGFDGGEQCVGTHGPDAVAGVFGVGVEDEEVGGGGVADGDDVQARQDLQGPFRCCGVDRWAIAGGQAQGVGAQRVEPDGQEAVVAAEVIEVVGAPVVAVVGAGAYRVGVPDVDEAEGRGVLEQDGQGVSAFQDR